MSLVELERFPNGAEAAIVQGRLAAEGIFAVCFDAGMNIAESVGIMIPVRVMVRDEDFEAARDIVRAAER